MGLAPRVSRKAEPGRYLGVTGAQPLDCSEDEPAASLSHCAKRRLSREWTAHDWRNASEGWGPCGRDGTGWLLEAESLLTTERWRCSFNVVQPESEPTAG